MAINLSKGGRLNLTKKEPGLKKVMIGLGWEFKQGASIDLDASAFLLGKNGKLIADEYFVFYNNLKSPDGAVEHTGDNRTGVGEGDDEMILFNLETINQEVEEIVILVSIHDADVLGHNFGLLSEAFIRVVNVDNQREILRFNLDQENPLSTEAEFGRFKKVDGEWIFEAVGVGTSKGLQGYVNVYA